MMLTTSQIKDFINQDKASPFKKYARVSQRYYEGEHDIKDYKLYYFNADGKLVEDTNRSNIKISHAFFTELVDQLTQYMLSGKEGYVFSDLPDLQHELDRQFNNNDDFNAELNDLITGTSIKGSEYMYVFKDVDGTLRFETADSLGIVEVRAKDTDDHCDYIIRWYIDRIDKDGQPIKKIEVWDKDQTSFYIQEGDSDIMPDSNVPINPRPHTVYKENNGIYGTSFGFIPFFRLENNTKKTSDLKLTKDLIDDYDLMNCSLSNNLQDLTEGIFVVKGFAGDDMNELLQNIKTKKAVGVSEDGDIDIRTVNIPYEARKVKMELDEKNIYRFGMGFNSSQLGDGNVTNVVIKSRYTLLDLKANKLEIKLKQFLKKLVKVFLDQLNEENGTAYETGDVYIKFTRETISNDSDNAQIELTDAQKKQTMVNTVLNLAGTLDSETVLQQICDVLDLDYEEIKSRNPIVVPVDDPDAAMSTLNSNATETAEDTLGHALNGAQTQSLLSILAQYKQGVLTVNQATNVLSVAIGISKEKAQELLQEG